MRTIAPFCPEPSRLRTLAEGALVQQVRKAKSILGNYFGALRGNFFLEDSSLGSLCYVFDVNIFKPTFFLIAEAL